MRFEREYSCNEGNQTWKIINSKLSEPSGLVGLISNTIKSVSMWNYRPGETDLSDHSTVCAKFT